MPYVCSPEAVPPILSPDYSARPTQPAFISYPSAALRLPNQTCTPRELTSLEYALTKKGGEGVGRHVSTSTLTLGGLNVHRHLPNALDDCVHDVPRMNRADAIGGAAQQHVSGQEGIEG